MNVCEINKMSKFLKHLGIGTGGKKSSGPGDFQAKTLPPTPAGKGYGRRETIASSDSSRDGSSTTGRGTSGSGLTNMDSSASGRRASHDSYRTMPARGLRSRPERDKDWSLRGPRSRESSSSLKAQSESEQILTGTGRRRFDDSKELRRSITTDEIGSTTNMSAAAIKTQPPPAVCIKYCFVIYCCFACPFPSFTVQLENNLRYAAQRQL